MGKVVLLTGGRVGLGNVIARHLASMGHAVYCGSRETAVPDAEGVRFLRLDVTSDADCREALVEVFARENRLDVIVNNAAVTLSGPTLDFSAEDFRRILETNVIGPFRLVKAATALPVKLEMVVNITSLNGFFSFPNFGLYSASKFAAEALGLALRYELAPSIRVVNVAPGALRAETAKKMTHKPAREKSALLNWLLPLTAMEDVARRVESLIGAVSVPPRVLIGRDAHIISMMQRLLPASLVDRLIFHVWRKK